MLNILFYVGLLVLYILNAKVGVVKMSPDVIYVSYFLVGCLVGYVILTMRIYLNRNSVYFFSEMVYYIKMSKFLYLSVLESIRECIASTNTIYEFLRSLTAEMALRVAVKYLNAREYGLRYVKYYTFVYLDRAVHTEDEIRRYIRRKLVEKVCLITRRLLN